jgi:hypothetical protein
VKRIYNRCLRLNRLNQLIICPLMFYNLSYSPSSGRNPQRSDVSSTCLPPGFFFWVFLCLIDHRSSTSRRWTALLESDYTAGHFESERNGRTLL